MEYAQGLVFHQEGLRVVGAEVLGENAEVFVAAEELVATIQFVGKALAEVACGAELREVLQHGGQYAGVILPGVEIEMRQLLRWRAVRTFGGKEACAGIFAQVQVVYAVWCRPRLRFALVYNPLRLVQRANEARFGGGVEFQLGCWCVAVMGEVHPVQLEQHARVAVRLFCNLEERSDGVLAGEGVAAVAAHLDLLEVVKKLEPALGEQDFDGGVEDLVAEREHLGRLLPQEAPERLAPFAREQGEYDVVVVQPAVRPLDYGNHAVVHDVDALDLFTHGIAHACRDSIGVRSGKEGFKPLLAPPCVSVGSEIHRGQYSKKCSNGQTKKLPKVSSEALGIRIG